MQESAGLNAADRLDGRAPQIQALRTQIRRLAAFDAVGGAMVPTLLLQGETGTGKGLVARIVHDGGPRASGPFIPVNCAAIPETMLEAELFGFDAGAFTDARRSKPGLFEAASGGTLFLDEIDALSLTLQSKLLTAIEEKRIRRLGAIATHDVDVKLVAATQQDLGRLAAEGGFRPDLYHRLAVVVLALPPLRERGDDVLLLARSMLERFAVAYDTGPKRLTRDAEAWLRRYPWPGNVRELGHAIERVTLLHPDAEIDARALEGLVRPVKAPAPTVSDADRRAAAPDPSRAPGAAAPAPDPIGPSEAPAEAARLRAVLARTGGNVLKAARLLGVTRDTLRYRMRRYAIARPNLEDSSLGDAGAEAPAAASISPASTDTPAAAPPSSNEALASVAELEASPLTREHKPAAIVAVELTWRDAGEDTLPNHEPWTEAARWERAIHEKLAGLGGVPLQRGPTLAVWGFGVPQSVDQMPQRAVHGALAVRNLAAEVTPREQVPELRLAVHLGSLIVDVAAPDPAARVLPVGETLRVPVRLLAAGGPGDVLVSAEVARLVEDGVVLEPAEVRSVGGGPALGYRVLGIRRSEAPDATAGQRGASPFVGRQHELATLREVLDAASTSAGQVVGIVGEPGAGKSRLLHEFQQLVRGRPLRYIQAHCVAYGGATPYLPLIEMLRATLELDESDPPETIGERVRTRLPAHGLDPADAALVLPLLAGDPETTDEHQQQLKGRTFEMFRRMILSAAGEQTVVLAFENVHWVDPTSAEWLAELADRLQGIPLLLIMTFRPGYQLPSLGRSYVSQIALRPLSVEASRQLLRSVVGAAPLRPETEELVLARAEGNPFFLEELGHALVEHAERRPLAVPDTVQAVLAARIDRLAVEDKRLLQTAAVIGRDVPLVLLEAVSGLSEGSLAPRLARLATAEFLVESGSRPRTCKFKHALTQAAAYASLAAEARRALHLKVVEALEALAGDVRPEQVEELAHHAAEGGAWEKAVGYLRRAASVAAGRGARREVVVCCQRALVILENLPEAAVREPISDIRFLLAHALYMAGDFTRARDAFNEVRKGAEQAGDDSRLAQTLAGLSFVHASEGRYDEAVQAGERALVVGAGDAPVSLWTSFGLARAHFALGNFRRAAECARRAIDVLAPWPIDARFEGRAGNLLPAVAARTWLAISLARLGEFEEAIWNGEEGVGAAEAVDGLQERVWAYYCLGRVLHARTDLDRAIALLRQAVSLCEGGTIPVYFTRVLSGLGSALCASGDAGGGLRLFERALGEASQMKFVYGYSLILLQRGRAFLDVGRLHEAETGAVEALALSRERGERGEEAWALLLHGEIATARMPAGAERARAWLDQALALGNELGMRPMTARARMVRGALELAAGRPDEASTWLTSAVTELRAMGIGKWLTQAERLLAEAWRG
jgi:DNA-binding NtrC family response regulator/tetratricopeptide (TPR) repeat protein